MAGLRERKKAATRLAIHEAGMRLFAERGFGATTVDDIADAADVSRATVFAYFPTKEEIVFGDAATAIDALAELLGKREAPTIEVVRAWLAELTGWLEPELLLQLRLRQEAPTVAARRLQIGRMLEDVIADALEVELGQELAARLTAAALIGGLNAVEATAAERLDQDGDALDPEEVERILDVAVAYVQAGTAAIATRRRPCR
jgi:AcrR family transcriptional regulator